MSDNRNRVGEFMLQHGIRMGDKLDAGRVQDLLEEWAKLRKLDSVAAIEALESIAANTCCGPCQEAKLVARSALQKLYEWACETCETRYAEYVNGCPHCWEAGIRSGVKHEPQAY